jgi:hypothetical protein
MQHLKLVVPPAVSTRRLPEACHVSRRSVLVGASAALLAGCGGGSGGSSAPPSILLPVTTGSQEPSKAATQPGPESSTTVGVKRFYKAEDGRNLQPAFQAALDEAAAKGFSKVVNDLGPVAGEMWCPVRTSANPASLDGIPLVVRQPVHIDFANAVFTLKGPTGGNRMAGQKVPGLSEPWLGGWLHVAGYPGFGRITVENVTVDGEFAGSVVRNSDANLTDKGFCIQDTDVREVYMRNVELRNFAGEIYYVGGLGPDYQQLENCRFHGSGQCAFQPGGVGKLVATGLQAGRAYQAAEVICGQGHSYTGCRFYEQGDGGSTFFGGPSPRFLPDHPYFFAYWDGVGERPWVTFENTTFEGAYVRLGAWMRGKIIATDCAIMLIHSVGHLRDIDLEVESRCDSSNGSEAVGMNGPRNLTTQMEGTPAGTYYKKPSNVRLAIRCVRSPAAIAAGRRHACPIRFYGGLLDSETIAIQVSGEARSAYEVFGEPAAGFALPKILQNGFTAV